MKTRSRSINTYPSEKFTKLKNGSRSPNLQRFPGEPLFLPLPRKRSGSAGWLGYGLQQRPSSTSRKSNTVPSYLGWTSGTLLVPIGLTLLLQGQAHSWLGYVLLAVPTTAFLAWISKDWYRL